MKVNIEKLLKHPKLFFLPSNVKIPISTDILKLHFSFKILLSLVSYLGKKEVTWLEVAQLLAGWEGSLNKFQLELLLDFDRYYVLPLSLVEIGEKNILLLCPEFPLSLA
jgi:hypothetical protein